MAARRAASWRWRFEDPHGGGRIPPELGGLTALRRLVISDNRSWGPIPSELGQLSELRELDLSYKRLLGSDTGGNWGSLTNLRSLNLAVNRLAGRVPAELAQLADLRELQLERNYYLAQCLPAGLAVSSAAGRHVAGLADV